MATSKIPFVVKFRKPGTEPPLFIAGSFQDPAWQPQEMQYVTDADGVHHFSAQVMVEPEKQYQFKFRVGTGDWWLLDEEHDVGTDESGNQNNILTVPKPSLETQAPPLESDEIPTKGKEETRPLTPTRDADTDEDEDLKTPLFAHESFGAYEFADDDSDQGVLERESFAQQAQMKSAELEMANLDMNDPTLEKFPSDRHSIIDALRTIQTHLDEDHVNDNSSARSASSRRASVDSADDSSHSLSVSSPTSKRRRDSRHSHSSFGRTRSAVSLGSIEEEPKPAARDQGTSLAPSLLSKEAQPVFEGPGPSHSDGEDDEVKAPATEVTSDVKTTSEPLSQEKSIEPSRSFEVEQDQKALDDEPSSINKESETLSEINDAKHDTEPIELDMNRNTAMETEEPNLAPPDDFPESKDALQPEPIEPDMNRNIASKTAEPSLASPSENFPETKDALQPEPKKSQQASPAPQSLYQIFFSNRRNTTITAGVTAVAVGIGWWKTLGN